MPTKRTRRRSQAMPSAGATARGTSVPGSEDDGDVSLPSRLERFDWSFDGFEADFPHHAKQAYWTVDEATALSFGKDPSHVNCEEVEPHLHRMRFARDYAKRLDLVMRAFGAQSVSDHCNPAEFIEWAETSGIALPDELVAEFVGIRRQSAATVDLRNENQRLEAQLAGMQSELEAARHEIEQLRSQLEAKGEPSREADEKIILALAIEKFGYEAGGRTSAAANIEKVCVKAELPVSDRIIRARLKAASEKQRNGTWRRSNGSSA